MIHPEYKITDVQHGPKRSLILVRHIREWFDGLGSRPEDAHLCIYRYARDIYEYQKKRGGSTKDYRGSCYADFLPIEIDGETLKDSGEQCLKIHEVLESVAGIPEEGVADYYSGNRGYHLMIPVRSFGTFAPGEDFPAVLYSLIVEIFKDTDLIRYNAEHQTYDSDVIDLQVYNAQHMLRYPNSMHPKSGLFKVNVTLDLVREGAQRVREVAANIRPTLHAELSENPKALEIGRRVQAMREAGELYRRHRTGTIDFDKIRRSAKERSHAGPGMSRFARRHQNYLDILRGGMKDGERRGGAKGRRLALLKLTGHFKAMGMPQDEATAILELWNDSHVDRLEPKRFYDTIDYSYKR